MNRGLVKLTIIATVILLMSAMPLAAQSRTRGVTLPGTIAPNPATTATANPFLTSFLGVDYDVAANTSTWNYSLTWYGGGAGLSHFSITFCEGTPVIAASPAGYTVGWDSSLEKQCGVRAWAIKWEGNSGLVTPGQTIYFSFTIAGLYDIGTVSSYAKAGTDCNPQPVPGPEFCEPMPPPTCSIAPSATTVCDGEYATFSVTGSGGKAPYTYAWSGPGGYSASGSQITVNAPGTYSVTVTDAIGRVSQQACSAVLSNKPYPTLSLDAGVLTCTLQTVRILATASEGATIAGWTQLDATTWYKDVTTPDTYTATADLNGCTKTASIEVTQDIATPDVGITGNPVLTCTAPCATLTGTSTTAGAEFLWTLPDSTTLAQQAIEACAPGDYILKVTAPNGCTNQTIVTVSEDKGTPDVDAGADKVITCTMQGVTLEGSSTTEGATFFWTGPDSFTSTDPQPVITRVGTYTLTVTGPNGCKDSDIVRVTDDFSAPVDLNLTGGELTCTTTEIQLGASSEILGVTYSWTGPGIVSGSDTPNPIVNVKGTYTCTATHPVTGCTTVKSIEVGQNIAPPDVDANVNDILTCSVTSVTISASSSIAGTTFNWVGPNGFAFAGASTPVSAPGSYTVTATAPNGCTNTDVVVVGQNIAPPDVDANVNDILTCSMTSVTISASSSIAGTTFAWVGPSGFAFAGASTSVTAPGTYTVTATAPNGCTNTDAVVVEQNIAPPDVDASVDRDLTCKTLEVTVSATSNTAGVTFAWSYDGTPIGAGPSLNVKMPGEYTVTATAPNGCTAIDKVIVLVDRSEPADVALVGGELTCAITSIQLGVSSSTGGVTYLWTGPGIVSGADTATPVVNVAGTYSCTATNPITGCETVKTVVVTENTKQPDGVIAEPAKLTCSVTSVSLSASSLTDGVTFEWSGPGIVSGGNSASPVVNDAGDYTVKITASNGCFIVLPVTVERDITKPDVSIAPAQDLTCTRNEVTLTASSNTAGVTYAWSFEGAPFGTGASITATAIGSYTVTATAPNGCTETASVVVNKNDTRPNVDAGADQTITCLSPEGKVTLSGSSSTADAIFSWSGPGNFASALAIVSVDVEGTYTLTVTDPVNGCTAVDTVEVKLNKTEPNADAGADQTITCLSLEGKVTLTGSSTTENATFSWSGPGGFTSSDAVVSVETEGTYTLTVTDPVNGCTAVDTVDVKLNKTEPNADAGADQTITCLSLEGKVTLTGSSTTENATFSWSGPEGFTSSDAIVLVETEGTYTLTVTDPVNGCTAVDTVDVKLNKTEPNADAGADQTITCLSPEGKVTLTGSSTTENATFSWSGPEGFTSSDAIVSVETEGTYTLTVTDPVNGCTKIDTVEVKLDKTAPNANAGEDQTITCASVTATITGSSTTENATFRWSGPDSYTSDEAVVTVNKEGVYTLTVTNPVNGCTATDTVEVKLDTAVPTVDVTGEGALTCTVKEITLTATATAGVTIEGWTKVNDTTWTRLVTEAGTYTAVAVAPNGCKAEDSATITLDQEPPDVYAGVDQTLDCENTTITLTATSTATGVTFCWTSGPGITAPVCATTLDVTEPGTYVVEATAPNGCTATDTVVVDTDTTKPSCLIDTPAMPVCGTALNTIATSVEGAAAYLWTVNSVNADWAITSDPTLNSITYTAGSGSATFTLTVWSDNGCTETCSIEVKCNPGTEFCSLTQGAYGNEGGKFNGLGTRALIELLLTGPSTEEETSPDFPLTIGVKGKASLTIPRSGAKCVIDRLPAGGTARPFLSTGDVTMYAPSCKAGSLVQIDSKSGAFKNVFAGQLIAFGLNLRLSGSEFAAFELCQQFTTQAALPGPDGLLGTEDDILNPGKDLVLGINALGVNDDPVASFDVPVVVLKALEHLQLPKTVGGLYILANRAIANDLPDDWPIELRGLSISDINFAVDNMNRGFDNCRFFTGCTK